MNREEIDELLRRFNDRPDLKQKMEELFVELDKLPDGKLKEILSTLTMCLVAIRIAKILGYDAPITY